MVGKDSSSQVVGKPWELGEQCILGCLEEDGTEQFKIVYGPSRYVFVTLGSVLSHLYICTLVF